MMNIRQTISRIVVGGWIVSSKERQKEEDRFDSYRNNNRNTKGEYPTVPTGFECFVCGTKFATNEERVQHLEKNTHGSMYDTGSPQEREDARRLR
jgi:CRISPR/Cas system-associated protein Cas10 (large subunit of type III CRISPR-Cas system)